MVGLPSQFSCDLMLFVTCESCFWKVVPLLYSKKRVLVFVSSGEIGIADSANALISAFTTDNNIYQKLPREYIPNSPNFIFIFIQMHPFLRKARKLKATAFILSPIELLSNASFA